VDWKVGGIRVENGKVKFAENFRPKKKQQKKKNKTKPTPGGGLAWSIVAPIAIFGKKKKRVRGG